MSAMDGGLAFFRVSMLITLSRYETVIICFKWLFIKACSFFYLELSLYIVRSIHVLAGHTTMYRHLCSQAISAFAIKACVLATKLHMLNFLRGLCHDVLWLWPVGTNNAGQKKIFCSPKKKSKSQNNKYNNDFRRVVISNSIPDALCDLHTSK